MAMAWKQRRDLNLNDLGAHAHAATRASIRQDPSPGGRGDGRDAPPGGRHAEGLRRTHDSTLSLDVGATVFSSMR